MGLNAMDVAVIVVYLGCVTAACKLDGGRTLAFS